MAKITVNMKEILKVLATFENGTAFAREVLGKVEGKTFNGVNATLAAAVKPGYVTKEKAMFGEGEGAKILTRYTITEAGKEVISEDETEVSMTEDELQNKMQKLADKMGKEQFGIAFIAKIMEHKDDPEIHKLLDSEVAKEMLEEKGLEKENLLNCFPAFMEFIVEVAEKDPSAQKTVMDLTAKLVTELEASIK